MLRVVLTSPSTTSVFSKPGRPERTYGEIEALTADLPHAQSPAARVTRDEVRSSGRDTTMGVAGGRR
jgi:hypothetical protein